MTKSDSDSSSTGGGKGGYAPNSAEATALAAASGMDLRVPYFCEENVWRLAFRMLHHPDHKGRNSSNSQYHVAFVSNASKCVAFLNQKAGIEQGGTVFWDYHVILLEANEDGTLVWDMDSLLPFPKSWNAVVPPTAFTNLKVVLVVDCLLQW